MGPVDKIRCVEEMKVLNVKHPGNVPEIVVICGSTKFWQELWTAAERETVAGRIVLVVGCNKSDDEAGFTEDEKKSLDALHRHKIDIADTVLVVTVNGYVGRSVASEISYAASVRKKVRFMEYEDVE